MPLYSLYSNSCQPSLTIFSIDAETVFIHRQIQSLDATLSSLTTASSYGSFGVSITIYSNMTARPPSRSASITHSRSASRTGGVMAAHVGGRSQSPRPAAPTGRGVERKPSISSYPHAHNRQASIVNGGIQHSRNPSFVNSPATSPLSPNTLRAGGAVGGGGGGGGEQITIPDLPLSPSGTLVQSDISALTSAMSTLTGNSVPPGELPRAPSQMDTMRTITPHGRSRGQGHGHSHSGSYSHHSGDPKTPAEYALHILFTQVRRI